MRVLRCLAVLSLITACTARDDHRSIDDGLRPTLENGPAVVAVTLDVPRASADQPIALSERAAIVARMQERVLNAVPEAEFKVIHRPTYAGGLAGVVTLDGLSALLAQDEVRAVQLDLTGSGSLDTSVIQISAEEWALAGVNGSGVTVAVLDSGAVSHPDLDDDVIHEACILAARFAAGGLPCPNGTGQQLAEDGASVDGNGHGTNVTGIVTSAGTIAPAGVAPGAEIASIKISDDNNDFAATDLVAALDYLITLQTANALDPKVINMSVGALVAPGTCNMGIGEQTGDLVAMLEQSGVLAVASSGNDSRRDRLAYPACVDGVFTVGAVDDDGDLVVQTNVSPKLDVLAPGRDILSTGISGTQVATLSGTSQAAPHVAACAALRLADDPSLTPAELKQILTLTSTFVTEPVTNLSIPRLFCGQPPTI